MNTNGIIAIFANMKEYRFDITPKPAPRLVYSDKWSKRKVAVDYFRYKATLKKLALILHFNAPCCFEITFVVPIPTGGKNRAARAKYEKRIGTPHQQKPDIDNLYKAFADALEAEDSHIHTVYMRKVWGKKGEIIVKEMPNE